MLTIQDFSLVRMQDIDDYLNKTIWDYNRRIYHQVGFVRTLSLVAPFEIREPIATSWVPFARPQTDLGCVGADRTAKRCQGEYNSLTFSAHLHFYSQRTPTSTYIRWRAPTPVRGRSSRWLRASCLTSWNAGLFRNGCQASPLRTLAQNPVEWSARWQLWCLSR